MQETTEKREEEKEMRTGMEDRWAAGHRQEQRVTGGVEFSASDSKITRGRAVLERLTATAGSATWRGSSVAER